MSSYLQRLVSSARRPGTAIRPGLGSLFSYSADHEMVEGFHEVQQTVVARQPETPAAPVSRSTPLTLPAPELPPARSEVSNLDPKAPAFQPAVARSDNEAFEPRGQIAPGGQPKGPRPIAETQTPLAIPVTAVLRNERPACQTDGNSEPPLRQSLGAEGAIEQPAPQVSRPGFDKPLVKEGFRPTEARSFQKSTSVTSDHPKAEKAVSPRRVPQAEREANDIQIHIGRIEVTAVPPPPARPAVQPVRKSLRLDEYLRRGREGVR